jgi:hypothetical protein
MNKHEKNRKEFTGNSPEEKISDPQTIANKFNEYFVNVGPDIAKKNSQKVMELIINILLVTTKIAFFLSP